MKTEKTTLHLLAFACLMLSSIAFSQVNEITDTTSEGIAESTIEADTRPDLNALPQPVKHTVGDVSYVSGGVGSDEAIEMKRLARSYKLEIVCVQKVEGIDSYITDVKVQISDTKGNAVLDIATDGPILLADLPKGKYTISAENNGVIKTNHVVIGSKKHHRLVFVWPM